MWGGLAPALACTALIKSVGVPHDHVIVCGYGRSGQYLSRFLIQENIPFIALDIDPSLLRRDDHPCWRLINAVADDVVLNEAVSMIRSARMPLVLLGAGANRKQARLALQEFIETTGIPFFSTQMGKGVVDEGSPHFLGTAALSDGDYLHCAIERADLIINVGHDVVEKPPFFMAHGGKKVIHVNYRSAKVDQVYFPQCEVVGDVARSVQKLTQKIGGKVVCDLAYFNRIRDEVELHIKEGADDDRFPIIPQRLVAETRRAMGAKDIIALDNGIYKLWYARNYKAYEPNTVLLDNALATMGAGLPSAMMAAMLYPDRRVMAICGDGGFMMNSQEMETAVRLGLNLVVVILNDSAYGMIRWKQAVDGFAHVNRFRSREAYQTLCRGCGLGLASLEVRPEVLYFPDLRQLTHELKALGAHNLNPGRPDGLTGRARIRALVEALNTRRPLGTSLASSLYSVDGRHTPPLTIAA